MRRRIEFDDGLAVGDMTMYYDYNDDEEAEFGPSDNVGYV
jgi:hypothetical protein